MANHQQNPQHQSNITLIPTHAADMPVSEEAEDAIIGAIIRNPEHYNSAAKIITDSKMFFFVRNEVIWRSMTALVNQSIPIDDITLMEYLSKKEQSTFASLEPFHFTLLKDISLYHNVEAYAEIVKEKYVRRESIKSADAIKSAALDESQSTDAIGMLVDHSQIVYAQLETDRMQHISSASDEHMGMVEDAMHTEGNTSIFTGFDDLDTLISGLHKRKFIVVGGLSHHGKTAMLLEIALSAAAQGANVALNNVADGDDVDLMNRLATMKSGVPTEKFIMGTATPKEYSDYVDAMGQISKMSIYMKSCKGMSPGEIERECKTLKDKQGRVITPDIIIIDYIQRMYIKNNPPNTRREELMKISQGLTRLGDKKHFNCPVVAGAQLRMSGRTSERPSGHDVQESKDIFQDCDVFMTVYRESLENANSEFPNQADIIVDKNKQTGKVGTVSLYFDRYSARLINGEKHFVDLGGKDE